MLVAHTFRQDEAAAKHFWISTRLVLDSPDHHQGDVPSCKMGASPSGMSAESKMMHFFWRVSRNCTSSGLSAKRDRVMNWASPCALDIHELYFTGILYT